MEATKINQIISLLVVFSLLVIGLVSAASSNPSAPSAITNESNTTTAYPNGTYLNNTRGYIYNLTITESQPTQKWLGYVGQISGEYALQDGSGNALYDWDIVSITGELYATKEGDAYGGYDGANRGGGGVPLWSNLSCATLNQIRNESRLFNHNATWQNTTDEDAYTNTFETTTFSNPGFYAGERQVTDTTMFAPAYGSTNCYGINLNENNADQSTNWTQVVLTDGTGQLESGAGGAPTRYDIVYAALLENDTVGYNGQIYDFQILIPQDGRQGTQQNVAFYFYVELI